MRLRSAARACGVAGLLLAASAGAGWAQAPAMYVSTQTFPPSPNQAVCTAAARMALNDLRFTLVDAGEGPATFGQNPNYTATVVCNARGGFVAVIVAGRDALEAQHYADMILNSGWPTGNSPF